MFTSLLETDLGANTLVKRKGLKEALQKVFAEFAISADGIEVSMQDGGKRLHLSLSSGAVTGIASTELHPFEVRGSAGSYTVAPGALYLTDANQEPVQILARAPLGQNLQDYVFNTFSNFTGYVVLRTRFSSSHGGAVVLSDTFVVELTSNPTIGDQPLIRYNGANEPQDGVHSIILADIIQGVVQKPQRVRTGLGIYTIWNEITICGF